MIYSNDYQHQDSRCLEIARQATIVHHHDQRGTWVTCGRRVLFRARDASCWESIGLFPYIFKREVFGWNRITQRFARADKCLVYPAADGTLIGIRSGVVYRFFKGSPEVIMDSIQGDCPLHRSIAEPELGVMYFGEYFMNPKRGTVRIIRILDYGTKWEVAHTFESGEIRHVHGVFVDPYIKGRLWVTTGDLQGENYIFHTDDHFKTLTRHGDGTQLCRVVGLLFMEDCLTWATDSPLVQNYSVSMDRKTDRLSRHQELPSSFWYAAQTSDGVFLAGSSVEKGPVQTNVGSVWRSWDGLSWERMISFRKDRLPMPLFKWGTISLPSGYYSSDDVWISGEALTGLDGISRRYSFNSK